MLAITSGNILPQVFPKVKGFFRGISKKPSPKERVAPLSAPPNPPPSPWRGWTGEAGTGEGAPYPLLGEGGRAKGPDGSGAAGRTDLVPPLFRRCGGTFPQGKVRVRPRRRKPSPTGKVDRAQPGPDEGKQPKSEKQAPLNGSNLHPMWPVSLFWVRPPHPSRLTACHLPRRGRRPPGGGFSYPLLGEGGRAKP